LIRTFPHSSKEKKKRMEGISRPLSSIGIDPGINVELKGMLKIALFELIDRCPSREFVSLNTSVHVFSQVL
jgi:hypothetical protein